MSHPDIQKDFPRNPRELIAKASFYQPAIFSDIMGRRGAMHGRIAALRPSMKLCGSAFTVDVRPGDNLMIHAALSLAQPGDVLVIDGKADQTCALMGAIMMTAAKQLGLAGVVMDAAVRDCLELEELGLPVFSVGTNPNGPTKNLGGRIGHAISCGGVVVHPGDCILADADGVVVVERAQLEHLLPLAAHKVQAEAKRIAQIKGGDVAASWLQSSLVSAGVLKAGESL
jgi:4-hydroxy-4-methyl-2-oxoglutarate aldolase